MRFRDTFREFTTFAIVGGISTILYLGMYNLLRLSLSPYPANLLAVISSLSASFWANRRFTFRDAAARPPVRQFIEFSLVVGITLAVSNAVLAATLAVVADPSQLVESLVLAGSVVASMGVRFWVLRRAVFGAR